MPDTRLSLRRHRGGAATAALLLGALALTACQTDDAATGASASEPSESASEAPALRLVSNARGTDVPVDKVVTLSVRNGTLRSVAVSSPAGNVAGTLSDDGSRWTASGRLEPGTTYSVKTVADRADGSSVTRTSRFSTEALTLDQQTYPSIAPLAGETVGVGMPVVVSFDVPVTDRASIEKHMRVTSTPQQAGSWHWMSDYEAHWRPKTYWKAGTDVHVEADINSVPAGNGIYGQESRELDFHIGDAHIYRVNTQTHQMKVYSNGDLLRTIPITTGKQPDFTTRSGVKVIIEKFASKDMNSETVGITGAEAYNIAGVKWAMRLTYSGEFIHAAPWSVGSQGHANVSHGCTGMSTADAGWLYDMTLRGDVVEYTGTDRPMTLDNGYGDWNSSFADYSQGSALS